MVPVQYWLVWHGALRPVQHFHSAPGSCSSRYGRRWPATSRGIWSVAKVMWGSMVCVYCLSHAPALMTLRIPGYSGSDWELVAFLAVVAQMSDVLQYVWGKLLGRHRVAPHLSPNKTVEGLVGGVLSATALGAAMGWMTPFGTLGAAGMAFAIAGMGFLGGLVMSAVKRDAGVKDYGHLIEGHGGVMDRVDSLAFAAPVFFHMVRYWYAG